ncbi:hypothetical protein HanIR_Chr09g0398991 [Helianthus annuus]|nr:hypothetical protein HanIR_Chr09g0398991 [Helianthus annuus]
MNLFLLASIPPPILLVWLFFCLSLSLTHKHEDERTLLQCVWFVLDTKDLVCMGQFPFSFYKVWA